MATYYTLTCNQCGIEFQRIRRQMGNLYGRNRRAFCSTSCRTAANRKCQILPCGHCGALVERQPAHIRKSKSGRVFCNRSCSASYHNKLRTNGRRSKCEKALFGKLKSAFPSIEMIPNDKIMLDGYEVDIAIPELDMAIEWNGIVHFQPIYGNPKLNSIQKRDAAKLEIARAKGIELIVVADLLSNSDVVDAAFFDIEKHIREMGAPR